MHNLKLVWWVFWRGLLYGGITGIVLGTLFSPLGGTIYGVLIGTIMGAALGLLDGLLLAAMTRIFFMKRPFNRSEYIDCARILTIPINFVLVLIYGVSTFGSLGMILALLVTIAIFILTPAFADYAADQLKQRSNYNVVKGKS